MESGWLAVAIADHYAFFVAGKANQTEIQKTVFRDHSETK